MTHPKIEVIEFTEGQGSPNGRITLCGAWPDRFINIGVETDGDYGSSTVVCASPGEAKELRDKLIGIYPLPAPEPVEPIQSKVTYDDRGNFEKTIRTDGGGRFCTEGFVEVSQHQSWQGRYLDFRIKADNADTSFRKFSGTISADCAIQLRDVLNLLYPVSAGEVAKPAAPPDAPPYTPKVGDRVVVCSDGLSYVKAAAGKEATIIAFRCAGYYTLKFDEPVPCDGGTSEKHWMAKLSEISPAPAPKVGDRVIVCDEGLSYVKAAAGREATIISFYGDEVAFPYTIKFDEFIPCDGGIIDNRWAADPSQISLAPSKPYIPRVDDRVVVGPDGLCGMKDAAGVIATVATKIPDSRNFILGFDKPIKSNFGLFDYCSWEAKEGEFSLAT